MVELTPKGIYTAFTTTSLPKDQSSFNDSPAPGLTYQISALFPENFFSLMILYLSNSRPPAHSATFGTELFWGVTCWQLSGVAGKVVNRGRPKKRPLGAHSFQVSLLPLSLPFPPFFPEFPVLPLLHFPLATLEGKCSFVVRVCFFCQKFHFHLNLAIFT